VGAISRIRQFSTALALSFSAVVILLMAVNVAASMAGPPPGNWSLTFAEEFNSAGLNTSTWTPGWQRNEVSEISERCVSPQFVSQPGDGYLHLSVQQTLPCGPRGLQETGAAMESNHGDGVAGHVGYAYSYGYVEWRVYLPGQANTGCPSGGCIGNWPALWTLPESHSSEIDVMEGLEKGLACYHFLPPFTGNEQHGACMANSYVGWHTFGANWEPSGVTYYYDGTAVGTEQSSGNSPSPEYLVMDVLPSRTMAPKMLNQAVLVDYVHVYQQLPIVTTGAATGKQPLQATLNGTVNANGTSLSNCHFDYGTSVSYGSSAPCSGPESGESATVSLTPGTTYHFRIVATNASGPAYGNDETFTTPGPVEAVTGTATSVQEEQATLTGTVNPRSYDSKYYFQYGTSTSYAFATSEGDAGTGSSPVPENAIIRGLQTDTVYHYRLVGTSGCVTSYGTDQVFTTQERTGAHWVVRDQATGSQWVYFDSKEGRVCYWQELNGGFGSWAENCMGAGSYTASTAHITVVRDPASGSQWVYFDSKEGRVCYWQELNGGFGSWAENCLGSGEYAAPTARLTAVRDPATGSQWVYFDSKEGRVCYWQELNGGFGSWAENCLGSGEYAAPAAHLTVVRDGSTSSQWVYFESKEGRVCYWQELNGGFGSWAENCMGSDEYAAAGSGLAAVRDAVTGSQWAYLDGKEGRVCYWQELNGGFGSWAENCMGSGEYAAAGSGLAAVRDAVTGSQWAYLDGKEGRVCYWQELNGGFGSWAENCLGVGVYTAAGSGLGAVHDGGTGSQWVYLDSNEGRLCYWQELNSGFSSWAENCLGSGEYVATGST
jgi:glycosyl hydrolase family 16